MGVLRPFDGPACARYIMPRGRSLDINTEDDFSEAEAMIEKMEKIAA
jgi:CMP-N-acetylneuraminic acid synthetase